MKRWVMVGLALGLMLGGQAAELPDMGASVNTVLSPAEEQQLGQAFLRQIRQSAELIDDPEIDGYLNALGGRLASHSDAPGQAFRFFVIKDKTINAFAVPGGFIGVHSGLILETREESELASVLAHEIAHVTQRHIARTVESSGKYSLPMIAAAIAAIVVGMKNPEVAQAAIASMQAGSIQMQINFTRAHEAEADRVGMQTLAEAGMDARSMPAFFERLQAATRYDDGSYPEFLRTHPVTTDRIAESRDRAEQYPAITPADQPSFALMRAKLLVLMSDDPARLIKQLRTALETGKYRDQRAVRYALALAALETRDLAEIDSQLAWLREHDGDRVVYRLLQAQRLDAGQQTEAALSAYAEALKLYPGDILLTQPYARALLAAGQGGKAKQALLAANGHQRPEYFRLLAEAHQAVGEPGEASLAMAEHYYLNGQTGAAVEQLKQTQQDKRLDFYLLSRIDARLRELEEELRKEKEVEKQGT